jgi:formylglycine-generating enzyme required for sulfatase activity
MKSIVKLFTVALVLGFLVGCGGHHSHSPNENGEIELEPEVGEIVITALDIKFAFIPKGTFVMGVEDIELAEGRNPTEEQPRHNVTITNDYYVGIYKVTQEEWKRVVEASNSTDLNATPSCNNDQSAVRAGIGSGGIPNDINGGCTYTNAVFANGTLRDTSTHPVDSIKWTDAQKFIDALNILEPNITINGYKHKYALPTEAQWERAIKADSNTSWYWGANWCGENGAAECNYDKTFQYAWFAPSAYYSWQTGALFPDNIARVQPVGQKPASAYGLYDMGSNFISEWVQDYYDANFYSKPEALLNDPVKNDTDGVIDSGYGYYRVARGGNGRGWALRSSYRTGAAENLAHPERGFRLALVMVD